MIPVAYRRGFSLVEVLMALAIGSLVLMSASSLLFSYSQLWINQRDGDPFEEHIEGVMHFLEFQLGRHCGGSGASDERLQWSYIPDDGAPDEPCLRFVMPSGSALLQVDGTPRRAVVAYLSCKDKDGLALVWHCPQDSEEKFQKLKKTVLSPLLHKVIFWTYNSNKKNWESTEEVKASNVSQLPLPQQVEFQFKKGDRVESRVLVVKDFSNWLPVY